MHIRAERPDDVPAIRVVNLSAFETSAEADLADLLRQQETPIISLVAEDDGAIVGHIVFSPVTLEGHPALLLGGLAPMAVVPSRQRQGIGSRLVQEGLVLCRRIGFGAVVVLGHPEFYPRFGFTPSTRFGLRSEYDVPEDVFMVLELEDGALRGKSGTVRYHPAFGSV